MKHGVHCVKPRDNTNTQENNTLNQKGRKHSSAWALWR